MNLTCHSYGETIALCHCTTFPISGWKTEADVSYRHLFKLVALLRKFCVEWNIRAWRNAGYTLNVLKVFQFSFRFCQIIKHSYSLALSRWKTMSFLWMNCGQVFWFACCNLINCWSYCQHQSIAVKKISLPPYTQQRLVLEVYFFFRVIILI